VGSDTRVTQAISNKRLNAEGSVGQFGEALTKESLVCPPIPTLNIA
jgi:hypothetical protein